MSRSIQQLIAIILIMTMLTTACGGSDEDAATTNSTADSAATTQTSVPDSSDDAEVETEDDPAESTDDAEVETEADPAESTDDADTEAAPAAVTETGSTAPDCAEVAALFQTKGSANSSLADPEVNATCTDDTITVTSNGIPDYTYIGTSPGDPNPQNLMFTLPAAPTATTDYTDVPLIGPLGVALNGVPIYGPTEGQGGDVLSLGGGLSECGSHNGPTGFHMHLFGTSATTDCIYTAEEVASAPQLLGYAVDGYPIYTGNDQYTSSWTLTDESLFATDTWAAHSYVEGSGDLDQCNGLTDADGNYAYYTTDTFPYVIGCFAGEVDLAGSGAGGGGLAGPGGDDAGGPGGDEGAAGPGGPDFTAAAATLGVTVEELEAALGTPPPDFTAAAATLGLTVEELEAALPAPPAQ